MKAPEITRTEDIVVQTAIKNQYGDLIVTDKSGKEHKVGVKRERLFGTFQPGQAIHLSYAEYMNKEYIADATPVSQMIQERAPQQAKPPDKPSSNPEKGMWWKEIGENFRAGLFKKDDGAAGAELWRAYVAQMLTTLEIKIEKKPAPESKS